MKSLRMAVLAMAFVTAMVLGLGVLSALGNMVKQGKMSAETLIFGIIVFLVILLAVIIAVVARAVKQHREHLSQSSSKDILAEIIAMGEREKQRSEELSKDES